MDYTLQKILFPRPEICMEEGLYYHRDEKCYLDAENGKLVFSNRGSAVFDTYFNSFSIGKWKKYTKMSDLSLRIHISGSFMVSIYNLEMINGGIVSKVIDERIYAAEQRTSFTFSYAGFSQKGIHCFKILSLEDNSVFYGGEYFTECNEDISLRDVVLAINICTFKREEYLYRNVRLLLDNVVNNISNSLYQKVYIYITDNAQTVDESILADSHVFVTKQNAFGSAGGFTRGEICILENAEKTHATHMIFMDDDIVIDPEVLNRTSAILQWIKDDYKEAWIGGANLTLGFSFLQAECGGVIENGAYRTLKPRLN